LGWVFGKYIDVKNVFASEITVDINGYTSYFIGNKKISFNITFNYTNGYFGIHIECLHNLDTGEERPIRAYWEHEM
jgi:hypothetical protein